MPADALLRAVPLVAILRGVIPARAVETAQTLFDSGFRVIEVPLNSPEPFESIEAIARTLGDACLCGAGTVIRVPDVRRAQDAGARLIVAPNFDADVVVDALARDFVVMPGIATATEAFAAIQAGATHLKLFPAATYGPAHLRALLSVMPAQARLYPVGGVGAAQLPRWKEAGAAGFGFGTDLFKPSYSISEIRARANQIIAAYRLGQESQNN
jgi:2-dehydro-3-deoxyphosphogalactonate aldolase